MKVLLVINKPNRETRIMESIKEEILSIDDDAQVEIREMCMPFFNRSVLKFKPDVILTFPFTCTGFAAWYYLFKFLFKCKILSLRAEGVVDLSSAYNIQWATGFDRYGKYLVDYELFWGSQIGEAIGQNLLKQGKLSSMDRVKIIGYPRLESYFKKETTARFQDVPARVLETIRRYPANKIILFATGFHLANYSRQNLFDARDLDAENRIAELLDAVELTKQYRQAWIDSIIQTASWNPDLLLMVKKHPIEKREDYSTFGSVSNILYIYEDIDIQHIVPCASLFFHYGSTSLVDAYLSKVPSVYVYSNNKSWYSDLGWPSSRKIPVTEIASSVNEYVERGIPFVLTQEVRTILKNVFDIEEGKQYMPSRKIAELILGRDPAQEIHLTDVHLWRSFLLIVIQVARPQLARVIKKILRMDPTAPLLKRKCPSNVCRK